MSCQMNAFGAIVDLKGVKKCLYLGKLGSGNMSLPTSQSQEMKEIKSEDVWGWSIEEAEKPEAVSHPNWLDECGFSLSPTGELLALTYGQNLIIMMSKWDSSEESCSKTKYHMVWHGDPCQENNEVITCVCVLPLAAPQTHRSSSHSVPDWTCVALGFSSGALRFYTEKGDLLFSEVLEQEPVVSIKCQTVSPARNSSQPELIEELHVAYRSVVCSIYGFVLSNTLKACRNQLARIQANCSDTIVAPPLSLHKWSLPDQDNMVDCAVGLPQCPSAFSHLHMASVCGGIDAWYRPSAPQSSLVVAVGNKPFVGFHYIVEGSNAPVLGDVVKAIGTKLKSALNQAVPSWFLGGRKPNPSPEREKVVIEPEEPMVCRFGLCDLWRQGSSVVMSPHRNLCVVSDSLGRVTLIDNSSGLALRMWKGYRDAQCGWLTAEEEQCKGRKRTALFLVIYAPKKGIVEVWAMQQGPRVATFTTSKNGRLFYIGHGLLGVSGVSSKNPNRSATPCFFVDEFGVLTEVTVPFHCALSDKNSKRARDIHLVRKLRQLLKSSSREQAADGIATLCHELQTNAVRAQALDLLASCRSVAASTLLEVVEGFLHSLECSDDENIDVGRKSLMQRCIKLQKLLIFYLFCSGLQQKPPDYETVVTADSHSDLDSLSELLRLSKDETMRLVQPPEEGQQKVRVKFQEGLEGLQGYLAGFQTDATSDETIYLVDTSANQNLTHISEVVCGGVQGNIAEWTAAAAESGIHSLALLRLTLISWLSRRSGPTLADTITLSDLITAVCNIAGDTVLESAWWEDGRSLLRESVNPHLAVIAAAVCKAVALSLEEKALMTTSAGTDDSESKSSDWEKVTQESCTWSLLISQLEDLALINSVLRHKPVCEKSPTLYCLPYDPPELSLQIVSSKGKGCVSELVARWVASVGLEPTLLVDTSCQSSCSPEPERSGSAGMGVVEGKPIFNECGEEARPISDHQVRILDKLKVLRMQFPYSLADSVLLANVTWEYILAWSRQVDQLETLQAAVTCLRVVPSPHLKHGVCSLIWTMHLRSRFESMLRLVNKVGKVPKERLCRQDIGLSELQVGDFFRICSDFLDIFMESRVVAEESPKEVVRHEGLWESSAVPPLQQLALEQMPANYDLLLLFSQCARALQLLAVFSLRTTRPLSAFFNSIDQSALFADVSSHTQLSSHVNDPVIIEARTQFLLRAVSAAVATIIHHNGKYNLEASNEWIKQCLMLAADWSIPADPLRCQQCYELYAHGYDRLAEEVIVTVNNTSALGSKLLTVAGLRMKLSMAESNQQLQECIGYMSPALSTWISNLVIVTVNNTSALGSKLLTVAGLRMKLSMAESNQQLQECIGYMSPALSTWISNLTEVSVAPVDLSDTLELVVMVSSLLEEKSDNQGCRRLANLLLDSLALIVNKGAKSDR